MERSKQSKIRKAVNFMIDAHDGQYRKFSGKEYAWHPVEVSKIVREHKHSKNKEDICIAALLHDTVEDCDVTLKDIEDEFGSEVSSMVEQLTSDSSKISKMGKADYLLHKMLEMSSYALVIKLADRLHNCSDLDKGSENFREKYTTETRYIIDGLYQRKLSDTHKNLIMLINDKISKFE
jgi:GTP pyrophosphokinase